MSHNGLLDRKWVCGTQYVELNTSRDSKQVWETRRGMLKASNGSRRPIGLIKDKKHVTSNRGPEIVLGLGDPGLGDPKASNVSGDTYGNH
jgi:hypothetical protein